MKIFIDFDGVLLDTQKLIVDMEKTFFRNGICENLYKSTYEKFIDKQKNNRFKKYSFLEHLTVIEKEGVDCANLKINMNNLLSDIERFKFKDADGFLEKFNKKELHLISFGDKKFQKQKIYGSGLKQKFNRIIIVDGQKSKALRGVVNFKKDKDCFFIDDRVGHLENVKKVYGGIRTIFLKRKNAFHQDKKNRYCDFEAKNLDEVRKIISAYNK